MGGRYAIRRLVVGNVMALGLELLSGRAVLQAALVGEPNMALSRLAGAPKV